MITGLFHTHTNDQLILLAVFLVCRAWHNSCGWKSRHGYLPPSVANRKLLSAMTGGEEAV